MKKAKVLFISQEIAPFLESTPMAQLTRFLPQGIQERGKEIRTFMPRFGAINERRNQLHEVIRLSGMNMIIDDTDHPLIIKVASIQSARMQVYFIDNQEYFDRKTFFRDENNKLYKDNDERLIFFCRGVLETVKKLGWIPDVIHCHGWITSLIPFYLKTSYKETPAYQNAKVVYSVYENDFKSTEKFHERFNRKVQMDGVSDEEMKDVQDLSYLNPMAVAVKYSDAVIKGSDNLHPEIETLLNISNKPVLPYRAQSMDEYIDSYSDFYDELLVEEEALME